MAVMVVAEAREDAQLTAITIAIQSLGNSTTCMSATEWVNAPGEMETEGAETTAQIPARLMGQNIDGGDNGDDEIAGEADSNNVEP